jgi:lipid-binding SYLF domain-containing protein
MSLNRRTTLKLGTAFAVGNWGGAALAADAEDAKAIIERARLAFRDVFRHKDFGTLRQGLKSAKAVLIYPEVLKAGFFLGGSGGTGVLLVRGDNDVWSDPAFYTLGAVSFGLQFGGQKTSVVILINTQAGIDGLMANAIKLGADASVAAGPVGAGQAANLTSDFVSYAKAKGAFLGFSVEGSVLDVRASLNRAYYGKDVTPIDIVNKRTVSNRHSAALRRVVAEAARG